MIYLKTILVALLLFFSSSLVIPSLAYAAEDPLKQACETGPSSPVCDTNDDNPIFGPTGILTRATVIMSWIVGVASVIMIIINGFKFVLSNGNADSVSSARNGILFAIIGLIIALSAQAIVLLILRRL
jgi:hypothetical protein